MIGAAHAVFMLISSCLGIALGDARVVAFAGALSLGTAFARARAWRTDADRAALANLLTVLRLAAVLALSWLAPPSPNVWMTLVTFGLFAMDGLDGYLARSRGESSPFGAALDMETDAVTVMVLSILLWRIGAAGSWVLIAGLWRYGYAIAIAAWPALGDCPPSRIYRWIFSALMTSFAIAFLPLAPLARFAAAFGTAMVSFSFLHSLVRSRALRGVRESARP